jgi:hypothetical protein
MLRYQENLYDLKLALQETRHRKQRLLYIRSLIERVEAEVPICENREFSFVPEISETSKEIAKRLNRDPLYRKRVPEQPYQEAVSKGLPPLNPVSRAIADKIAEQFGSVDAYLDSRRKDLLMSRMHENLRSEEREMRECTFRPVVYEGPVVRQKRSKSKEKPIEHLVAGMDSFVRRQEKARELKALAMLKKPGSGETYTGAPTQVVEFKFSSRRDVQSRE